MLSSTSWRRLLRRASRAEAACLGAALVSVLSLLPSQALPAARVYPVPTDLSSDAERMISYRHQERMWQTADGALHLVVNRGNLQPTPGLGLHSSFDGGASWQLMQAFGNTNSSSTADGELIGGELSLVFAAANDSVVFAQLAYDIDSRTWALSRSETAFALQGLEATNPTLAIDDTGTVWCSFVGREKRSKNINLRLVSRASGGNAWADTGLIFGPTDNESKERSARPIRVPNGMGMVYRVRQTTYWATRSNGAPQNDPWNIAILHEGAPAKPLADPYASHFSVTTDDQFNIHLILVNYPNAFYFRLLNGTLAWSPPLQVDGRGKSGYVQISFANGRLAIGLSANSGSGSILVSADLGATFLRAYDLVVPSATSGISYKTPRLEAPSRFDGSLPLLQQYEDNGVQRLMLYTVPGP